MYQRVRTPLLTLCLWIASLTAAQDLPQPIVGCEALGCPTQDNGAVQSCNVANESLSNVGLARISDDSDTFAGLSLVKGVNVSASENSPAGVDATYDYTSIYYLGKPSTLDSELAGCAVIFHDTGALRFPGTTPTSDTGVCADVIADSCISSLEGAARGVANASSGAGEASYCSSLSRAIEEDQTLRDNCRNLTGNAGNGIGRFTVTQVADFAGIMEAENASSNCWPITPKSDGLFKIADDEVTASVNSTDLIDNVHKITPILTLLIATKLVDLNGSLNTSSSSHLTCVKVVGDEAPPPESESSAPLRGIHYATGMVVVAVGMVLSCL